ncbi:15590_t:CDS:2 [Cetraspora pellucida]|uniref:15590_t:CDS:1 n=1 Tax=Cetraspora pellucida TaxID=1433469 RepID=A0A9N9FVW0_9GLOM|nr:15590_t:CDS:2 [Cetraspora pellucida]
MTELTLYSDKYIIVTSNNLTIKDYYFPFGISFTIPLTEIISVDTAEELSLGFWAIKGWGMAFSNIWFAFDLKRHFISKSKIGVVKVQNHGIRKGFSVEDDMGIDTLKTAWRDANN